ncbi:hypothetical protein CG709_06525 [Lachnotalea glycerini]|nr:hypothetical protein CG709_06525 [Lachnotalea glycerini]
MCYFLIIFSVWFYITTISINIISILIGSHYSVAVVLSIQLILVLLLNVFDTCIPFENNLAINIILLKINPISHLVISWHSSKIPYVNKLINLLDINFVYDSSIVYLGLLGVIITMVGCIIINNKQIIYFNRETGGL